MSAESRAGLGLLLLAALLIVLAVDTFPRKWRLTFLPALSALAGLAWVAWLWT